MIAKPDSVNQMKNYLLLIPFLTALVVLLLWPLPGTTADNNPDDSTLRLVEALGCRGCHRIQGYGGTQAANLTDVGNRLTTAEINVVLTSHTTTGTDNFMPTYSTLTLEEIEQLSSYLYQLQ